MLNGKFFATLKKESFTRLTLYCLLSGKLKPLSLDMFVTFSKEYTPPTQADIRLTTSGEDISKRLLKNFAFDTFTLLTCFEYSILGKLCVFIHRLTSIVMQLKSSLLLTIVQTIITLFINAWVAYGLAAYRFKLDSFSFRLVLIVMMIPFEIIMLLFYLQIVDLKLSNTYIGIILPFLTNATTIFLFRQYLMGLSKYIVDAGYIDGLNEYRISLI